MTIDQYINEFESLRGTGDNCDDLMMDIDYSIGDIEMDIVKETDNVDETKSTTKPKSLFTTASGKKIAPPSKDAIERGRMLLNDISDEEEKTTKELPRLNTFTTASGKKIAPPSKEAIERGRMLLLGGGLDSVADEDDVDDAIIFKKEDKVSNTTSFSTASGRKVAAPPKEAFERVKRIFDDSPISIEILKQQPPPQKQPDPSIRLNGLKKKTVFFDLTKRANRIKLSSHSKSENIAEHVLDIPSLKNVIKEFGFVTRENFGQSSDWIENHTRHILWKYLSIKPTKPCTEYLKEQLLLRYEREVQQSHRSIVKMISEGDASPSISMCLLIYKIGEDYLFLSDGWYTIKMRWNPALRRRAFKVGQKVFMLSARAATADGIPSSPLTGKAVLAVDSNSLFVTKRVFQPLGRTDVKIFNTSPALDGGLMALMDFRIVRVLGFRYRLYSLEEKSVIIDQITYSLIERGSLEAPFVPSKVALIVTFRVQNGKTVTIWNYKDDPFAIKSLSSVVISFLKPFNEYSYHSTPNTRVFVNGLGKASLKENTDTENKNKKTNFYYQPTPINGVLDCCGPLLGLSSAMEKTFLWMFSTFSNQIASIQIPQSLIGLIRKIPLYKVILFLDLQLQLHDHKREILLLEFKGDSQIIFSDDNPIIGNQTARGEDYSSKRQTLLTSIVTCATDVLF